MEYDRTLLSRVLWKIGMVLYLAREKLHRIAYWFVALSWQVNDWDWWFRGDIDREYRKRGRRIRE